MKAISILQPWASLIVCGAKDVENRTWTTKYRGLSALEPESGEFIPLCRSAGEWMALGLKPTSLRH